MLENDKAKKFQIIYKEYYDLHPDGSTVPSSYLYYLHRQWIFPNHIDVMLDLIKSFHERFYPDANLEVALYAALLHDAGLIYKRISSNPVGHEVRSCQYAKKALKKHGFDDDFISKVSTAILATDPKNTPRSDEGILVRNADAYSHLSTIHFFAKARFSSGIRDYLVWLDKKIKSSIKKLTIPELIEDRSVLVDQYSSLFDVYFKYNRPFIGEDT